ncbi:MAG TPA: ABATE domain-containing protein [Ktedonobacterales bacterium]|nr:ABATE domain-containing protein [Ktedonobacterales bacterium]
MAEAAPHAEATELDESPEKTLNPPGSLALDLINTEALARGKCRDFLPTTDALARWWDEVRVEYPEECASAGAEAPNVWTSELLAEVKALRNALRILVTQVVARQAIEAEALEPVNAILALTFPTLERTDAGTVSAVMRSRDGERGRVLAAVAHSALRLLTQSDWRRLRQCQNDRCIFIFQDTTRSGTRRWCTPICMNRARSIRRYRMSKQTTGPK